MKENRLVPLLSIAFLLVVLGAWQLAVELSLFSHRLVASPTEVASGLVTLVQKAYFWEQLWSTLKVIGGGFLVTSGFGFLLGVLLSMSEFVRKGLYPVVVAGDLVPKVTLIPIILIMFGYGSTSRFVVVVISAFFPVFLSTLIAMGNADEAGDKLLRSLRANRLQRLVLHRIPQGLPTIFAGLKISLTVSFIGGLAAELLIRNEGLGYLITQFRGSLHIELVFAVTIVIGALGALMFWVLEQVERRLVFWNRGQGATDSVPL